MHDLALNGVTDDAIGAPSLVHLPHPLNPSGKVMSYAAFLPGETLGAYLERTGTHVANAPMHVWHNGRQVPPALWRRLIPKTGDQVMIRAKMEGGGGGSKVLRTVAMIALVVVSAGYGASLGTFLGVTDAAMAGALGSSLIMMGGTLMISPLLPEIVQ
ncbi:hypothetical protein D3C86_1666180 [compost metagenome]